MFPCQYCELRTLHFYRLLRHYNEKHASLPHFAAKCVIEGCTKTFRNMKKMKAHIKVHHKEFSRRHMNNARPQNIDIPERYHEGEIGIAGGNEEEGENIELEPIVNPENLGPSLKKQVGLSLLALREKHKIPANLTHAITEEIIKLVTISQEETVNKVIQRLEGDNMDAEGNLRDILETPPAVVTACLELNSQRKLESYIKEEVHVVLSEEIVLGHEDKLETLQYVPIDMTLKNLLQYEDVFSEVMNGHQSADGVMRDVVDGLLFQEHPVFSQERTALGLILYLDDFTVTNPLRMKSKSYKITATYLLLANLPPYLRSQLQSIQLVSLCKAAHVKKYGLPLVLEKVIQDLKRLEENGIDVVTKDGEFHFSCELLLVVGDNLAQHQVGGFFESFQSLKCCRFCMVDKADMRQGALGPAREVISHDEQVKIVEDTPQLANVYGLKGKSVFSGLGAYHAVKSLPSDVGHDIFEGVAKTTMCQVIKYCVEEGFFSLADLNNCIATFPYKGTDKVDKPSPLNETRNVEVKQTMSQMWCFIRLFPLMVGYKVPDDDSVWDVLLLLLRIVMYICSPALQSGHVDMMGNLISEFYLKRKEVFPEYHLVPKDHYLLHYQSQMKWFGPLIHLWTMRLEAKHSYFIDVLKTCKCYKNVCLTMAKRHQFLQSTFSEGKYLFNSSTEVKKGKLLDVNHLPAYLRILVVPLLPEGVVHVGTELCVGNTTYTSGMAVVTGIEGEHVQFAEISKALVIRKQPYLACQALLTVAFDWHINAFTVERTPRLTLINISELQDHKPLGIYSPFGSDKRVVVLKHKILEK